MAIIKCDEELPPVEEPSGDGVGDEVTVEPYVEQDEVSIGKTLLAVESICFSPSTPFVDVLPEVRNSDISDTFRADAGLYWYLSDEQKMVHPVMGYIIMVESEAVSSNIGKIGMSKTQSKIDIIGHNSYFTSTEQWDAVVDGTDESRPSPLIPAGSSFEDHAFEMNTPFSKKELEMFANISNAVSVADVESDYDFFTKAYEEGIASTNVPENALPHLYTEVQKGESNDKNTTELPEGYFRKWLNDIISDQHEMNEIAQRYENVAILDSSMDATNIIDSETRTTSAFEILMSYANRENLFPMNINIEVDTDNASDLMFQAEDVGMVDDIVRLLMGDGNVELAPIEEGTFVDEPEVILTNDVLEDAYNTFADSMAKLNQNPAITAYVSDNLMAQIETLIADAKSGALKYELAIEIQSQLSAMSNGSISGVDLAQVQAVVQDLTNLIDSNSLMNNLVQTSNMVNKNVL